MLKIQKILIQFNSIQFDLILFFQEEDRTRKEDENNKKYSRQGTSKRNSPVLTANAYPSRLCGSSCPDCCGGMLDEFYDLET
jgi:hypothetical protein